MPYILKFKSINLYLKILWHDDPLIIATPPETFCQCDQGEFLPADVLKVAVCLENAELVCIFAHNEKHRDQHHSRSPHYCSTWPLSSTLGGFIIPANVLLCSKYKMCSLVTVTNTDLYCFLFYGFNQLIHTHILHYQFRLLFIQLVFPFIIWISYKCFVCT